MGMRSGTLEANLKRWAAEILDEKSNRSGFARTRTVIGKMKRAEDARPDPVACDIISQHRDGLTRALAAANWYAVERAAKHMDENIIYN